MTTTVLVVPIVRVDVLKRFIALDRIVMEIQVWKIDPYLVFFQVAWYLILFLYQHSNVCTTCRVLKCY